MTLTDVLEATGLRRPNGLREAAALIALPPADGVISLHAILNIPRALIEALVAVTGFERSSTAGKFSKIAKAKLVNDLRKTIQNPLEVKQQSTPFCGPASIAYELIRRKPAEFVRACREIYETGKFRARDTDIKASGDLRNSGSPISVADWLFCATLRDDSNIFFDVDEEESDFVNGVTTPGEMKSWTRLVLGLNSQKVHTSYLSDEVEALRKAQQSVERGGVGFLMIHSDMLNNPRGDSDPKFPDHWIVLLGDLRIRSGDNGRVAFSCFSWGRIYKVDMPGKRFENLMWGSVVGH